MRKPEKLAYNLIAAELEYWKKELDNENSEANLYGLTMVDVVYHIHNKLNESGL
jgi:hypothetical protein